VRGATRPFLVLVLALVTTAASTRLSAAERLDVVVRGKTLTLAIYRPPGPPRATILMGSGDVGWVGLAVSLAEELSAQGYLVAGINTRQYLSAFTSGKSHLRPSDVPADYRAFRDALTRERLLASRVIVSGVSEGAALSVLAASDTLSHSWIDGVITMGLPPTAELAWRWTDVTSWISKRDADEPSFAPEEVIAGVAPCPIWMIQSRKDEYVPPSAYGRLFARARDPKHLTIIDASNHRFTDKRSELSAAYAAGVKWIAERTAKGGGS
jgi:dienelactone hydrolase